MSVKMLEVRVTIDGSRVTCAPEPKITSLGMPLDGASMHPMHVQHWPISNLKRMLRLCTDYCDRVECKAAYIKRFEHFGASELLIAQIRSVRTDGLVFQHVAKRKQQSGSPVWLTMGYHPVLRQAFSRTIVELTSSEYWNQLYRQACQHNPSIRTAWFTGELNLQSRVRSI